LTVLLFVFWYCHKRGREVRLEKERQLTEEEMQKLDVEFRAEHPDEHPTTTADKGASIEDVKAGIQEVEAAKQATEVVEQPVQVEPNLIPPTTVP
jgi:predicted outer membrane protein